MGSWRGLIRLAGAWCHVAVLAWCLVLALGWPVVATAQPAPGQGYVDSVRADATGQTLELRGWVVSESPSVFVTNLIVQIDGATVYRGRFERYERPDVVAHTGRSDWLWAGFMVHVPMPSNATVSAGRVAVLARMGNGQTFQLGNNFTERLHPAHVVDSWGRLVMWLAWAALSFPVLVLGCSFGLKALTVAGRRVRWVHAFAGGVALSFVCLVGLGVTGSSLLLGLDQAKDVVFHDGAALAGSPRPIRSDEWEVLTPYAISQANHVPPFPVRNMLLGEEGHNMLVMGMSGVPVAHVSVLAKPATWGFFVMDLRHALAWYWWFPFFACFAALWGLLVQAFKLDWRWAALLAMSFSASPYSVVFSGWPAYQAFFLAMGVLLLHGLLQARSVVVASTLGVLLGIVAAGFVFVLYPAWAISLAYLLVPFCLAWWWYGLRGQRSFGAAQRMGLALAIGSAAVLVWLWWLDAGPAVDAMRATVYPGQRVSEVGGDIESWFLAKGWLTPWVMHDARGLFSEVDASFVWMWVPVFALAISTVWFRWRLAPLVWVSLAYAAGVLVFMHLGVPVWFAKWSLWGQSTSYRQDLGLGLAQTFVLAGLLSLPCRPTRHVAWLRFAALAVSLAFGAGTVFMLGLLPVHPAARWPIAFSLLAGAAAAGCGYLLFSGQIRTFVMAYVCWMGASVLSYNPLVLAPSRVQLTLGIEKHLAVRSAAHGGPVRSANVGPRVWSVALPAAGAAVANSVFYYPQLTMWQRLDPLARQSAVYNRYQRLMLATEGMPPPDAFRIQSPRLDEVRLSVDPQRFDFHLLGADRVLGAASDVPGLSGNAGLGLLGATSEWGLFDLIAPTTQASP